MNKPPSLPKPCLSLYDKLISHHVVQAHIQHWQQWSGGWWPVAQLQTALYGVYNALRKGIPAYYFTLCVVHLYRKLKSIWYSARGFAIGLIQEAWSHLINVIVTWYRIFGRRPIRLFVVSKLELASQRGDKKKQKKTKTNRIWLKTKVSWMLLLFC